jgi:hypothetical protein
MNDLEYQMLLDILFEIKHRLDVIEGLKPKAEIETLIRDSLDKGWGPLVSDEFKCGCICGFMTILKGLGTLDHDLLSSLRVSQIQLGG